MAAPPSAAALLKAPQDEGLTVIQGRQLGHPQPQPQGRVGPLYGVVIHHTVTSGTSRTVDICRAYTGLPGPLCHGVIAKDGAFRIKTSRQGRCAASRGNPDRGAPRRGAYRSP